MVKKGPTRGGQGLMTLLVAALTIVRPIAPYPRWSRSNIASGSSARALIGLIRIEFIVAKVYRQKRPGQVNATF